jgi:early secretory antigenic target protein ESAT-6
MSPKITFDTEQITGTSDRLATASRGIQTELETLEAEALKLMGSWSGEAREAYREAQMKWSASLVEMRRILDRASTAGHAAAGRYGSIKERGKGRWG